jgi:UDP-xylose/UDP-N-acetylglucosamine transporter B4
MGRFLGSRIWRMLQVSVISISHIRCPVPTVRSNALTLERVTSEYPKSGSLITLCQFLLVSFHGLPKFIEFTRGPLAFPIPRLRPPRLPLTSYLIQVALFYFVSLLNNLAFGYNIPMPVHIIFRSGGLVVSILMGWLLSRKS